MDLDCQYCLSLCIVADHAHAPALCFTASAAGAAAFHTLQHCRDSSATGCLVCIAGAAVRDRQAALHIVTQ